jgi:hypothetical protein
MRWPETRMNTAVRLVERLDDVSAQLQHLFVGTEGHVVSPLIKAWFR